ncbi:MAG: alanine dehydrogenase [Gammaproteobacteria bacterium]|nr:MAG: alanine dehydrogenase [Gammaproteobacteria bacterium]
MIVGVPKEIKNHEYRVGLTPEAVHALVEAGHDVLVEQAAGEAIGFTDALYEQAGARIVPDADAVFDGAEMIVKVKEPQAVERKRLKPHHTLFTYLHLAPDVPQTDDLLASGATCIAYETVTDNAGRLPLLAPMSEVAGRMSIQAGARCLERSMGGRGVLLAGVPGVEAANVVILGGGVVGFNAAQMAVGMGANVTVLDKSIDVLRRFDAQFGNRVQTRFSTAHAIEELLPKADLVIGAVLIPGAAAPKLVRREHLKLMKDGAAVVDVAIDQGGCFETSRATTHAEPTFIEEGVVHYCVANMPGAVARTSTLALNNATLPFVLALANKGAARALAEDANLLNGLNVVKGQLTRPEVGAAQNRPAMTPEEGLKLLG